MNVGDLLDRYGADFGFYLGNNISNYDEHSLFHVRPDAGCEDYYYDKLQGAGGYKKLEYKFKVLNPFNVRLCTIAPFFEHTGRGTQYRLYPGSITADDKIQTDSTGTIIFNDKTVSAYPAPIPSEIYTPKCL